MANHMAEVARMLGVELGEEFKVACNGCVDDDNYCFAKNGIYNISKNSYERPGMLVNLLTGITTIKRKPWKPKYGEEYWHVTTFDGRIGLNVWCDVWKDINYYKLGNCYRTREEAEANRDKWVKFYASDEVLEV